MTYDDATTTTEATQSGGESSTEIPPGASGTLCGNISPLVTNAEGSPARLLSAQQLLAQLTRVLPRKPCHRTLQRWAQTGLPYRLHPGSRQRLYLFQEVYEWLCSRLIQRDIAQEAIDRSLSAFSARKSVRKSA